MSAAFQNAFGYELWVANAVTAADNPPTDTAGLTKIVNLENAPFQGETSGTSVTTYDSEGGFEKSVATSQKWSIPVSIVISQLDPGYQLLKAAYFAAVSSNRFLKVLRKAPVPAGGTTGEVYSGIARVNGFQEDIQAGNVSKVSFTLEGYGGPVYTNAT